MIGKTISHYKILEKLGQGGRGVVYKAEDTKLRRSVALKFLPPDLTRDPEAKARFVHEAQAASGLQHNNICTIHEIDETSDGKLFICMDCYEGETLKQKVERGPLSIVEAVDLAMQIAEGLSTAHQAGMLHRDVKPANVIVTNDGVVKIVDFGLAKLADQTKLTKIGTTVGTPAYMSPEQVRGGAVDHRTDIWSLGVVLYGLVTGRLPFKGEHIESMLYSILNEEPESIVELRAEVPVALERIVTKALEKDPERRYQKTEELLADLRNLRDEVAPRGPGRRAHGRPRSRFLAPALVLLVVAVGLLVGIRIKIGRQPTAQAADNKLAIMYFDNMANPEDSGRLGEMVTSLLIADLSESHYMQVVSEQRLYAILRQLGLEGVKTIDRGVATQVAVKAGAKWMLLGKILQTDPQMILMGQVVDVESGDAIASQRIRGEEGEEIFSLVDKLTVEIKDDLSLPSAALMERDGSVSDVTTTSQAAYRYYLEGIDHNNKHNDAEALSSFEKAVEHDSTFAMGHYWLAALSPSYDDALKHLEKAVEYSERATQRERHYIRALELTRTWEYEKVVGEYEKLLDRYPDEKQACAEIGAIYLNRLHEHDKAMKYLTKAMEMDPLDKNAYNILAYAYSRIGDLANAIWAVNKYIELAPREHNPYDTAGEIYAMNGMLDEAIASFEKALEIKPNYYYSMGNLARMYIFKKKYDQAREIFQNLAKADDNPYRSNWRANLFSIPLYQGRFTAALAALDDCIAAERLEGGEEGGNTWFRGKRTLILNGMGDPEGALEQARTTSEMVRRLYPGDMTGYRHVYARILAENGKIEKAEAVAESLRVDLEDKDPSSMWEYWRAMGFIERVKGNPKESLDFFKKASNEIKYESFIDEFLIGRAYLEAGMVEEAVDWLERALTRYIGERLGTVLWSVEVHYQLGLAYERSGWTRKAIAQYEEFLDIWKDADPGIEEIDDAKERLERLRAAS